MLERNGRSAANLRDTWTISVDQNGGEDNMTVPTAADLAGYKTIVGATIDTNAAALVAAVPQSKPPNLYFYKLPLALSILSGFLCVFLSPFLSPDNKHRALMVLVAAVSFNGFCGIGQLIRMLTASMRLRSRLLDPALAPPSPKTLLDYEPNESAGHHALRTRLLTATTVLNHAFIVPNYAEDIETLSATLNHLASHPTAGNYTIVLAMEAKESTAVEKATTLQSTFDGCFKSIIYTMHTMQTGEMPGKASNVNAAVRQFYPQAKGDKDSYMLTVIDADARVPYLYVQELEAKAVQVNSIYAVYAAPVMFEQNAEEVPALVRYTDYTWAALAHQNLNSWFNVGFPISNYSLPLSLAHEMGYWDTWPDAIGEDMHLFIKAFYHTNGVTQLHPLHAPINMCHVSSDTFIASLWARFMQAERHMRGISDTGYVLKQWSRCGFTVRNMVVLCGCLEAHLLPAMTFTALALLPLYWGIVCALTGQTMPHEVFLVQKLGGVSLIFMVSTMLCFEYNRYMCRKYLYRLPTSGFLATFFHLIQYAWLMLSIWFYALLPIAVVTFKHLLNITSMTYVVGEKRSANKGA